MWNSLAPQLPVRNVAEAQRYFRDVLGFEISWIRGDSFGAVQGGKTEIFLNKAPNTLTPSIICALVDDADSLFAIYRERGAKIVEPPENKPWGIREFTIEEPNGHQFRIGSSLR